MAAIRRRYVPTTLGQVLVRHGGHGAPVVLLHNTYLSSQRFTQAGFLESLADRYQVFAPDAIGQGHSDLPPGQLSVADYAANLAEVFGALGLDQAHLVGSHTGATIALELAVSRPDLVDSLVFLGLPMWTAAYRDERSKLDRFKPWTITADGGYLTDLWTARLPITHGLTPGEMNDQFLEFLEPGPRVHEPLYALFAYEPRDRLPDVRARTLAIASESDAFGDYLDEIAQLLPLVQTGRAPAGTVMHAFDAPALVDRLATFLG
ncbi:MAG: alpha/beta hydrolase [Dehalococcoidia bacterium]